MNQFEKPKTTRYLKKTIAIIFGLLMIAVPIGVLIKLFFPSDTQFIPATVFERQASLITSPVWSGSGNYAIFDHHTHTTLSDGVLSQKELVDLAVSSQCDALVLTDHSDVFGITGLPRFTEINALRAANPDLLLFSGLEINIASYNGREHLTLITHPDDESRTLDSLRLIAEKDNDDSERKDPTRDLDRSFFNTVNLYNRNGSDSLVIYNHPSRMDITATENKADLITWGNWSEHFIGFEGGPGHQNTEPHALYEENLVTVNRWDHIAANVGDVWDQMLGDGYQLWGALASSDFHDPDFDFAPCTFSRTHLELEERTHNGVLKALRAGTFWADHGRILNQFNFSAGIAGIDIPAYPGSVVQLGNARKIELSVTINRGTGSFGKPLDVEFISNCRTGRATRVSTTILPEDQYTANLDLIANTTGTDRESCYVRSVVRLKDISGDLLAMSNPIRFMF